MTNKNYTKADIEIQECIAKQKSFSVIAGAGSGKTTSLIWALNFINDNEGLTLSKNGQRVACITYTKRAVEVISSKLNNSAIFAVSTIHSFLWSLTSPFQGDIRECIRNTVIPFQIERAEKKSVGNSKEAQKAREKIIVLKQQLVDLDTVEQFNYDDSNYSDFSRGIIGHDDMVLLTTSLIQNNERLRVAIGHRYPYIFIDEAQDTFQSVKDAFNAVCSKPGLPVVGLFGDPMQQIYDKRTEGISGPAGSAVIEKPENFRSAPEVINFTNRFRDEVQQIPGKKNATYVGSVSTILVKSEKPEQKQGRRYVYSEKQAFACIEKFDLALEHWGWNEREDIKHLYLVHQMIARRQGFLSLLQLFTGDYASQRSEDKFKDGTQFLINPFVELLCPLVRAWQSDKHRAVLSLLAKSSPEFCVNGQSTGSLKESILKAETLMKGLSKVWENGTLKEILIFSQKNKLFKMSERLTGHLNRAPRTDDFDKEIHSLERIEWLADAYFKMKSDEVLKYERFIKNQTPYSTQHGSKGEEYEDVLVVFDDVEANWSNYNFLKLLAPTTHGNATDGQVTRGKKLAYVCFSRAIKNLRIILFTPDPVGTQREFIDRGFLAADEIEILK